MTADPIYLGMAPGEGREAVDQCVKFKVFMRDAIGRDPEGAYLKTMTEGDKRGLAVVYEPEVEGAEEWAKDAQEMAEEVWSLVARAERVRRR